MDVHKKLDEALEKLLEAKKHLNQGNKRLAVGCLDFVEELSKDSIWLLISAIELDEGKF